MGGFCEGVTLAASSSGDDVETDIAGYGGSIVRFYSIEGILEQSFRVAEQ